jgi:hypothetical protein
VPMYVCVSQTCSELMTAHHPQGNTEVPGRISLQLPRYALGAVKRYYEGTIREQIANVNERVPLRDRPRTERWKAIYLPLFP